MPTVEERLAQLEKQVPLQTEGLRRVTEGKYNGPEASTRFQVSPTPQQPWSRVDLVGCASTPASQCQAAFGVPRSIIKAVAHDTQGYTIQSAIDTWRNTCAASAQLVVGTDGECVLAVPIEDVAWHAGTDASTGRTPFWKANNVNPYSVGIEFCGFAGQPYTDAQYNKGNEIAHWLEATYGVPRVQTPDLEPGWITHASISNQRTDPGPTFDWSRILA